MNAFVSNAKIRRRRFISYSAAAAAVAAVSFGAVACGSQPASDVQAPVSHVSSGANPARAPQTADGAERSGSAKSGQEWIRTPSGREVPRS